MTITPSFTESMEKFIASQKISVHASKTIEDLLVYNAQETK